MTTSEQSPRFRCGLVQMCSSTDVARNIAGACTLISDAVNAGAHYVQTPEMTTLMELDRDRLAHEAKPEKNNPALSAFSDAARDNNIWLHIGSMAVALDPSASTKANFANRAYLFSPDGHIAARYDKIHMFDVELGNAATDIYRESETYRPGNRAVLAALPWGNLGMTICYDLRFPALHRALAQGGADFIAGPAAFTRITGEAHWHALLRARAIEAQAFVFAAGQGGRHDNGRDTYGHSLIVSPWGEVLADGGENPGIVVADIDTAAIRDARRRVPSLRHDRPFELHIETAPSLKTS
jgi:deaminated glutathione amidase